MSQVTVDLCLLAAPILHQVATGVLFDPLDAQGPFGTELTDLFLQLRGA